MIAPEEMIDELNGVFGRHPGCRALHARGRVYAATFTATPAAAALTRALHMQGEPVPATVRLSNGGGDPTVRDTAPDVRGLAVKLQLPDGTRTDISTQTIARSPTRTPDDFITLVKASQRRPSSIVKLPWFLLRHPETVRALGAVTAGTKPPASFATSRFYGFHAFRWVDAEGGARHVRYTFVPEAEGEAGLVEKRGDYLQDEFAQRLARGPVRFFLDVQIAAPGDDADDATATWSGSEVVRAGTLEITGPDDSREQDGDVLVFDPCRVVDGIELTDDPILRYRTHAYSVSIERRAGVARPADYRPGGE